MDAIRLDLRHAIRQLARRPGFAAVAALTLALGIGLATAMFSVVDGVLLRPLAYAAPDALFVIRQSWEGSERGRLSPAEFQDYVAQSRTLRVGGYVIGAANLSGEGEAERVRAAYISAGAFAALGVAPAAGRWIAADEDVEGPARAVVLGDGLWRRRLGGADVLGRTLMVDGAPAVIVGVMPRGFELPQDLVEGAASELFLPLGLGAVDRGERGSHFLESVARVADGTGPGAAAAEVRALAARFVAEFPGEYPEAMRFQATIAPLRGEVVGDVRGAVLALFGAVVFVLLIACANVANLLLARADGRRREFAVRVALGAGRGRLVRQLAVEHLVLALAGALGGVVLARFVVAAVRALAPADLPRMAAITVDARALAFAAAAAVLAGLAFGLLPALRRLDAGLAERLRESGPGMTAGRRRHRLRRTLVVAEATLATVLVACAGLMVHSFTRLQAVEPGYRTAGVLTGRVSLPTVGYDDSTRIRDYFGELLARARSLPGVEAAGAVTGLPLTGTLGDLNMRIEGRDMAADQRPRADWQVVTPGYFQAMGLRLVRGRGIEDADREDAPGVVVINEALARRYWPDSDPLGARFQLGGGAGPGVVTVVGVVGDVRHASLGAAPEPEMYLAHRQFRFWNNGGPATSMTLVLQGGGPSAELAGALRRAVAALDPAVPLGLVRPMDAVAATSVAQPRFLALLFTTFSAAALLLAGVGLYGVLALIVSLRTNEFAVRLAFGASERQLLVMVLRDALGMAGTGIAAGLAVALLAGRLLRGMVFAGGGVDPVALGAAAAALLLAAALAAWVPARRALSVAPAAALRAE